jgi:hypothetical protein
MFLKRTGFAAVCCLLLAGCGFVSADYYNNVPIPGRRPQFEFGTATEGIDFEIIYDLMCSDSAFLAPEFEKFLAMQWNVTNTTVAEAVKVTYTFLPLPYHNQVWIAHKLLPLLLDECRFGAKCQFMDYLHYCF